MVFFRCAFGWRIFCTFGLFLVHDLRTRTTAIAGSMGRPHIVGIDTKRFFVNSTVSMKIGKNPNIPCLSRKRFRGIFFVLQNFSILVQTELGSESVNRSTPQARCTRLRRAGVPPPPNRTR